MGFNVAPIILAAFIILQYYGVDNKKLDVVTEYGLPKIKPGSVPLANAGYIIQQVTNKIHYVGQIYYYDSPIMRYVAFLDRKVSGSLYSVFLNNGNTKRYYFKEISNETLATVTPVSESPNQFIFGSDRNLRMYTKDQTYFTEPLIHFSDKGFVIYSAHCDPNGIMFILLIGTNKETENLGKFYKIKNKQAELVINLNTKPRDFRFNNNYTSMYMVHDYGRKIADVKYNVKTTNMGNVTEVFDKDKYPELKHHIMTSVVVDRDLGHLWVTAAGKEGYVLEINPFKKILVSITPVPNKDLTFLTFGTTNYDTLFVGSKSTCTKGEAQGTVYAVSGMGRQGVADLPIKW